jgi:hypothetical protein
MLEADSSTGLEVGGDHDRRCVSRSVSRAAVEHAILAPQVGSEEEAEGMRDIVKPTLVSDLHYTRKCMLLINGRLLPLVGGRFVTYKRDMGNDGGGSDDLRSTIVLNAILILAGIFTTNLPQLTNMPLMTKMRRSSTVQGPGTKDGQNEVSSAVERSVTSTDEVMMLGEEGLGLGKPLALTSPPGYGLPKRPPPMRASTLRPLPAPGSIVGEPSTRALLAPSQNSLIISYPSPPLPPPPPPPAQLPPQPLPLASSPGHGPPETPPPMRALPRAPLHPLPSLPPLPPIGMVVPVLMTCSRQPTLPSPQHQSRQQPLTSRSSRSTFKEPWDSRSAHSVLGTAVPPPQEWSSFN